MIRTRLGLPRVTSAVAAAAVVIAAIALAAAIYRVPALLRAAHRYWTGPSYSTRTADFEQLRYVVSTEALERAAATIPRGAVYSVVVGNDPPLPTDAREIPLAFQFFLLPRRFTTEPQEADWVIAYHHSAETLGVPYTSETGLGPEATVVNVKR